MKWFKHFSDAHTNEGLRKLANSMGMEGVGIWWTVLEIIAAKMDETERCHATYSVSDWCSLLSVRQKKLSLFLVLTEFELGLKSQRTQNELRIECRKLLELRDDWTKRLSSNSEVTPAKKEKEKKKELTIDGTSDAREQSWEPVEPPKPPSFDPPSFQKPPQNGNGAGKFNPSPELKLLVNDLLNAAGVGDSQDRKDIAWDVFKAVQADNEQAVHTLIAEIKAHEHDKAQNLVAVIRARLKSFHNVQRTDYS